MGAHDVAFFNTLKPRLRKEGISGLMTALFLLTLLPRMVGFGKDMTQKLHGWDS